MRDYSTFRNRSHDPDVADLRLPHNQFWLQTQSVLAGFLLATEYRKSLYVQVAQGPGKTLTDDICDFLLVDGAQYLLLVGNYGVGKTSALSDVEHQLQSQVEEGTLQWIYFDGNVAATEIASREHMLFEYLNQPASQGVLRYFECHGLTHADFLRDVFAHDPFLAAARLLSPVFEHHEQYFIDRLRDPRIALPVALRFLARKVGRNRVVLVVDNLDALGTQIQLAGVSAAQGLAVSCGVKIIVSIRRDTERLLRYHHRDVLTPFVQIAVVPPNMLEVIRVRVGQALQEREAQTAVMGSGALRARVSDSPEFAEVLTHGLDSPKVSSLLHAMSNDSVREALHFAMHVYSGPYLDAARIIRKLSPADQIAPAFWGHIPYHVVVKSLILRLYRVYRADVSWICNIFSAGTSKPELAPFVRLYIILCLGVQEAANMSEREIVTLFDSHLGIEPTLLKSEVEWLVDRGLVEADPGNDDERTLRLTRRGSYFRHNLHKDSEYLTHIATDVKMYPELSARLTVPADRITDRLDNLCTVVEFLVQREREVLSGLAEGQPLGPALRLIGGAPASLELLRSVEAEVGAIELDPEDSREESVFVAKERLAELARSAAAEDLRALVRRYLP